MNWRLYLCQQAIGPMARNKRGMNVTGTWFARAGWVLAACLLLAAPDARAAGVVIGVIDDMTGPLAALAGPGDVTAAEMAVADFGGEALGAPIRIMSGDHQNKPDIGASLATEWYTRDGVTMITGLGNSAVALAGQAIAKRLGKIDIVVGASTEELTRGQCSPMAHTGPTTSTRSPSR